VASPRGLAALREGAALYLTIIAARIRAQLQYRASFALEAVGMFLVTFLDFVVILIIFANVPALAGWSRAEVALLYAISALCFAFTDLVVGQLDWLSDWVRNGTFDGMLVRPRGTLFQVISSDFQIRRVGKIVQGLAVLAYALVALDIQWTPSRALMLVAAVPSGTVIFISVWVLMICVVFWTVDGREAANAFTYGGSFLAQFPMNIYDRWLRRILGYLVPIAFVAYFPALFILGKPDPLGLPTALQFAAPFVAIATAVAAGLVWRVAVRHYQSAGG
jgi:ABC-2 type transport system permease protein